MDTTRRYWRVGVETLFSALRGRLTGADSSRYLLALALGSLAVAHAQSPTSTEPLLRVEVGAHAAPIRALSVDAAGQFAVTAADDKTARVWSLSTGALLQTLRPPIGPGNDGKLFATAITPDGTVIAAGGWSADNDVYLFERGSGQLLQRITGLPNTITRLVFAPDGRSLAVGLWGSHGVRLFGTESAWRTSRELGADRQYEGDVNGADFSPDGKQLATTSADGAVRRYQVTAGTLKLALAVQLDGGRQPFGLVYSPDGNKLAVGFSDTPVVTVLLADSLAKAYAPDVGGLGQGSVSALAWSRDGHLLYGAGTWRLPNGRHGLRQWSDQGRGAVSDRALARNSVTGLRALADGRLVFAATDPAWGWVAPSGEHLQGSGLADFRNTRQAFRVSRDGSGVAFGVDATLGSASVMGFDLSLAQWQTPQPAWLTASASSKAGRVDDWLDSARPKLNGRALPLADNERSMSAALAPASGNLALGTSFYLRYYQPDGTELWHVPTPGPAWQVNVSGDGRWVLAALGDGTVRWFRSRDGVEQLSLLPHSDGKRWVVWTPQGHYLASPGGEDLFGWHVPRGASRSADFFAGSRLRATLLRPDIIHRLLATADLDTAVREADLAAKRPVTPPPAAAAPLPSKPTVAGATPSTELNLPPLVTVLSPTDGTSFGSREITLSITIRAPRDAPTMGLRARVNGNILELPQNSAGPWLEPTKVPTRSVTSPLESEVTYSQRITLPAQDLELMLFAQNRHGYSSPAVLRLKWTGPRGSAAPPATASAPPSAPPAGGADLRPTLYVLAVGVSKYRDPALQLDYAAKDADDFVKAFKAQEGQLYRKVSVRLLRDDKAKRDDILDGLEWIRREMTARDVGVVFFGGHGVNDSDGVYYFLPQDVDVNKLKRSGVIFTEIRNTLAALPGKALFFIDTCHSGNVLGTGRRGVAKDITAVVNELSSAENGVIVFAASTGRQASQESAKWGNGAFTRAVIEGMGGKADTTGSGRITHKMLDLYISERVKAMTRGTQSPVTIVPQGIADFPVAITR
ncbi:caspase family protein [Rhodoferax sp.]|uniref:caspase family protein n=1 Tax=Rhodoferax sp. TaxID=50421 RepID=UPI0027634654|nr:caspase family protein [Rhodoferax sp.]